jgi:hypothetical protein
VQQWTPQCKSSAGQSKSTHADQKKDRSFSSK